MVFCAKRFDGLTTSELYEILRSRSEIFMLEQNIHCQDMDGVDYDSLHCFLWDGGRVVAYLRAFRGGDGRVHIGRVLSIRHGEGLGGELMRLSMPKIKEHFGCEKITLHSQCHAEGFYLKLGFRPVGEVFLEEGIEHVEMEN